MIKLLGLLVFVFTGGVVPLFAETPSTTPSRPVMPDLNSHPDWPKADESEVTTIVSVVQAFFSAISAPPGGKIDRDHLRSLFVPGGRIVVGLPPRSDRAADVIFLSPEGYADISDRQTVNRGFFDRNVANQVQRFGVMAHVYSTYESRENPDNQKPMARGIKSFELLNSSNRWYIVQVYWDSERPDNAIPDRYLHDNQE